MLGSEDPDGVRIKRKHDRGAAKFVCIVLEAIDNRGVTAMHAVEVAYR